MRPTAHGTDKPTGRRRWALPAVIACVLACAAPAGASSLAAPALGGFAKSAPATPALTGAAASVHPNTSAVLEQCVTASADAERSATFAGEMGSLEGATRLEIRIDVLERLPGETRFHSVTGPGVGVWLSSAPGVKAYRYLRQVTNLSAPASYRGGVHFRWLNAKGHILRAEELLTPACQQPVNPPSAKSPTGSLGS